MSIPALTCSAVHSVQFSSLEPHEVCRLVYVKDVQITSGQDSSDLPSPGMTSQISFQYLVHILLVDSQLLGCCTAVGTKVASVALAQPVDLIYRTKGAANLSCLSGAAG